MKFGKITTIGLVLSAAAIFALNGCSSDDNDDFTAKTCAVDFTSMEVLGYPYQPQEALDVGLNGSGLSGLAINSTGSKAYVVTSDEHGENHLVIIDTASGDTTLVTDGDVDNDSMDIQDLAMQPGTGKIFGDHGDNLITIAKTADTTYIESMSESDNGPGNLAFGSDGTLYRVHGNTLYTVNPATAEDITETDLSMGILMMGLGYNAHDGLLYAAAKSSWGDIYTIDPSDGTTTYVGKVDCPNGDDSCALHDLDFDPSTGEMFGVIGGAHDSSDPDDLVGAAVKWSCQ